MTKKRYYYNTFYHRDDMDRVLEYEIIDRESYPNYPNHNESESIPKWYIYIGENDSGWQDMLVDRLNAQDDKIKELQERNDRQRKRLDELSQLILNRDYDGQEAWIKDLEECEQLLQYESKLYCE